MVGSGFSVSVAGFLIVILLVALGGMVSFIGGVFLASFFLTDARSDRHASPRLQRDDAAHRRRLHLTSLHPR